MLRASITYVSNGSVNCSQNRLTPSGPWWTSAPGSSGGSCHCTSSASGFAAVSKSPRLNAAYIARMSSGSSAAIAFAHACEEQLVQARVVGQLGVEGDDDHRVVAGDDRTTVHRGEDLDAPPHLVDPRCPDEHGAHRLAGDAVDVDVGLERADLAPKRVAARD